ncbi:hypothetical protein LTR56_021714 [Elasticomyces elasticus]|nr:hypothetical protein LTR56_021714 [Elasticomyces elasticus]
MDPSTLIRTPEFHNLVSRLTAHHEALKANSGPSNFGYQKSSYKSKGPVPTCNDGCEICVRHYLSLQRQSIQKYTHAYTDAEANEALLHLTQNTAANIEAVKASIALYGDTIIRRWKGKNIAKRTALLLKAKPNISTHKWLMTGLREMCMRRTKLPLEKPHHDVSLLPFVDLPTLSESPHPLLMLLHVRTKHSPAVWATYDSEQLNFQFTEGLVELAYNPHCVCLKDGPDYGMLLPYNKEALHRGEIEGFPRAHLVLLAQNSLSDFFKRVVDLVLVDRPIEGDNEWQRLAADDFRMQSNIPHTIAFYHVPPQLSIAVIVELVKLRHTAAKKELRRVQTDPYYLREILALLRTSTTYRESDTRTRQAQLVETSVRSYTAVEHWNLLEREVDFIRHKYGRAFDCLDRGAVLPAHVDRATRMLQQLLIESDVCCTTSMAVLAYTLPSFGELEPIGEKRQDPRVWAATQLAWRKHTSTVSGALSSTLLGLIGDCLPKQASRDSRDHIFRELYVDAVVRDEILAAIRYSRPQCRVALSEQDMQEMNQDDWDNYMIKRMIIHCHGDAALRSPELCRPLETLLALPSPDKATRDSLDNFDKAHLAMAEFWEAIKAHRIEFYNREGLAKDNIIDVACHRGSSEYLETRTVARNELETKMRDLEAKVRGPEDRPHDRKPVAESTSNLQPLQTTWGPVLAETISPATPKEKPKTRPAEVEVPQIEDLHIEPPEEQPVEQRFVELTKQRSLDLFQRMYTPSACAKGTASVKWTRFVAALSDAGCSSVDGAGSSLKFVLTGWGTESVCIHKGHPDDTINPIALGDHGRSFAERWGWCYDTFKLRGGA